MKLLDEHEESKLEYVNNEVKLFNKKEDLFNSQNISKWEMSQEDFDNYDLKELLGNKELAMSKILPKETTYCLSLKRNYAYHLSTLLSEYKRIQKAHSKHFKHHFLNLSARNTLLLSDVFSIVKLLTCSA